VVLAVADSYEDVVRAWFAEVGSSSRLISVQTTDDNSALRISVDPARPLRPGEASEISVGRQADRQALRALLPHERVEFVAASTGRAD
jgi:hypothetical protein